MAAPIRPDRRVRCALVALAGLVSSACTAARLEPLPTLAPMPAATAEGVEYRHEVAFATDSAEPAGAELSRLDAFLDQLPAGTARRFVLTGRADERVGETYNLDLSARRARAVASQIRRRAATGDEIAVAALGEGSPATEGEARRPDSRDRSVDVAVTAYLVRLPGCPDWSRDPRLDRSNLPLSNIGCANATNLGLMVADPADLARGRDLGAADATREAEGVVRYRTDKVKKLRDEALQQP